MTLSCPSVARVLLEKCDKLRDENLPALGVLLDDRENRTAVKYVGKEAALKERRNMEEALEEKRRLKEENRRKEEEARVGWREMERDGMCGLGKVGVVNLAKGCWGMVGG